MINKYLDILRLDKEKFGRDLLEKMLQEMKDLKFDKILKRYNKLYNNKPNTLEFYDREKYKIFISQCNLFELKAILFDISEKLIYDKSIDILNYRDLYIFLLNRLDKKEDSFYLLCIDKAYEWVQGVISQGNRLIDKKKSFNLIINNDLNEKEKLEVDKCPIAIEEHFFVIALGKSIDFIKRMKSKRVKEIEDVTNNVLKFIDIKIGLENISDMRNMREHDDEYIEGKGNKPESFFVTSEDGYIRADATSTINIYNKHGDKYYLGNKIIEINTVVEVYKQILPIIEAEKELISRIDNINNINISSEEKFQIEKVKGALMKFAEYKFKK